MSVRKLVDVYRPASFAHVIGQRAAVCRIRKVLARGWGGRSWWLSGPSGTGKTTLARILAAQGCQPSCISELDASMLTPARIWDIEQAMHLYGLPPLCGRAWIVNEAHGLRQSQVLRQLLVLLEDLPPHVCWIMTTLTAGEQLLLSDKLDSAPLLSRCTVVRLAPSPVEPFARHAARIATREGLDGLPLAAFRALARRHECNLRGMLQEIETGELLPDQPRTRGRRVPRAGQCHHCFGACRAGRKFCCVRHYFDHLAAIKAKR